MSILNSKPVAILSGILLLTGAPYLARGIYTGETPQNGSWSSSQDLMQLSGGLFHAGIKAIAQFAGETDSDRPAIPSARPEGNAANGSAPAAPVERQRASTQASGMGGGAESESAEGVDLREMLGD
jgi:hypothetical protein